MTTVIYKFSSADYNEISLRITDLIGEIEVLKQLHKYLHPNTLQTQYEIIFQSLNKLNAITKENPVLEVVEI